MSFKSIIFIQIIVLFNFCYSVTDRTLEDGAVGLDVVEVTIKKIKDSQIFPDDNGIMKRIAYVESKFGENSTVYGHGQFGGIWMLNKVAFDQLTLNRENHQEINDKIYPALKDYFKIDFTEISYNKLREPLLSGIFARMFLHIINEQIPEFSSIEGQAAFWRDNYNDSNSDRSVESFMNDVNHMEKTYECRGRMDLAIVMDGSGSIGKGNYILARRFVANLIDTFSLDSVKVGFVVFSAKSEVIFGLDSNLTADQMKEEIMKSPYPALDTQTDQGIDEAIGLLTKAHQREGTPKIMAIFTDGRPDPNSVPKVDISVDHAQSKNITIFAIGIGRDIGQDNLLRMTKNNPNRVFSMSSYKSLSESFKLINAETCKVPQKPAVGKNLTDILHQFEKRYFHYPLPREGITVKIHTHLGKCKGFFSYKHNNPSSALNDGEFEREVFIPYKDSKSDRFKRAVTDNSTSNGTVFVTIEGKESNNNYTIASEQGDHTSGAGLIKINVFNVIISTIVLIASRFVIN